MGKRLRRDRLRSKRIKAAGAQSTNLLAFVGPVQIEAAGGEPSKGPRRFSMLAYTGGALRLPDWRYPVVVDLQGLEASARPKVFLEHDTRERVGHIDKIDISQRELHVSGAISASGRASQEVRDDADAGFPWEASIGAHVIKAEWVPQGKTALANGQQFAGPVTIARRARLAEVSFVALGADENTSASIAAGRSSPTENPDMKTFEQWLEAKGFALDHLTDGQQTSLRAMHDAETRAEGDEADQTPAKPEKVRAAAKTADDDGSNDPVDIVAELRADGAKELKRQSAVRRICAGKHSEIEAKAIEEGWDETKVELHVLRASRARSPAIHAGKPDSENLHLVLEAALCRSGGVKSELLEASYDERVLEASEASDLRGAGLHTLMYETIEAAGMHVRPGRMTHDVIRTAFEADRTLRASGIGFSTYSVANILSNVGNKVLLQSFQAVMAVAPDICSRRSVSDFKGITSYRMTMTGAMVEVGPTGELKHVGLDEDSFTNAAKTFGGIIVLARKDIINDDLGAFLQIPALFGRQSAITREKATFTLLLSNPSSFYHANNKNLLTGGTSVLSIGGLTLGEQLFMDQTDKNGDPVLVSPAILLTPTGLKVTAQQLMTETRVNEAATAGSPKPANNPHAGKWQPKASPYLNGQGLAGQSATAWYLFADPADVAAMQLVYLNDRDTPIIESGTPDFDTLGIGFRCYFDFGVAMQDFRGSMKSNGA